LIDCQIQEIEQSAISQINQEINKSRNQKMI